MHKLTSDCVDALKMDSLSLSPLLLPSVMPSFLYLNIITEALTMVYANNVPIDINSTSFSKSKSKAIKALNIPETAKFSRGT